MEENQVSVVTEQQTADVGAVQNPTSEQSSSVNENKVQISAPQTDRTFTRDEVTKILKKRLDRYQNSVYQKYGVKDVDELDSLFNKAKEYDDIVRSRDEYAEKVAFLSNNINPDKYDDIRTYFKGKGLQFTEDALKQHLETHPEWVKSVVSRPKTTITSLGTEQSGQIPIGEKEMAERMFGMKF